MPNRACGEDISSKGRQMIRRLSPALPALLACTALLAGCGSSGSSSGSTAATSGSSSGSGSTAATPGSTGSSSTATTGTTKAPASAAAAIEQCKKGANVLPTLPQATKRKLEAICEKAASGDKNAVRAAAREACEEIIKASPLPPGALRDRALSKCKQAGAKAAAEGG
jgi:hypothetical protein